MTGSGPASCSPQPRIFPVASTAKFSGSTATFAPCPAASASKRPASSRLAATSWLLTICMAATCVILPSLLFGSIKHTAQINFGFAPATGDTVGGAGQFAQGVAKDLVQHKQGATNRRTGSHQYGSQGQVLGNR